MMGTSSFFLSLVLIQVTALNDKVSSAWSSWFSSYGKTKKCEIPVLWQYNNVPKEPCKRSWNTQSYRMSGHLWAKADLKQLQVCFHPNCVWSGTRSLQAPALTVVPIVYTRGQKLPATCGKETRLLFPKGRCASEAHFGWNAEVCNLCTHRHFL